MLTTDQVIAIVVPVGVSVFATAVAFILTSRYQEKTRSRDIILQKLQRKSEWALTHSDIYLRMASICFLLNELLRSNDKDNNRIFYHTIHLVNEMRHLTNTISMFYFDEIDGEIFAEFMDRKTYGKIMEIFANDVAKVSNFANLISREGTFAELKSRLEEKPESKKLYDEFVKWISDKTNAENLREHIFVFGSVLEFETLKMLLVTYGDEHRAKEAIIRRYDPKIRSGLPNLIEKFNDEFEKQSGFRFKMYEEEKLII